MQDEQPCCYRNSGEDEGKAGEADRAGEATPKPPPIVEEVRAWEVAALFTHEPTARKNDALFALFDDLQNQCCYFFAFFIVRYFVQLFYVHVAFDRP